MSWNNLNILNYKKYIDNLKPRFRCILLIIFGAMFFIVWNPTISKSENWILFYNAQDEIKYYFDKDNLQKPTKNIVQVWQKKVKIEDDTEEEIERLHLEMDCKKRTYRILSIVDADSKSQGATTQETEKINTTKDTSLTFNSIIGSLYENICR